MVNQDLDVFSCPFWTRWGGFAVSMFHEKAVLDGVTSNPN